MVHYRTHKPPPPVPILGQPNLVHIPTSYLLEIRYNIIHLSTPRSPQWSPSLRFPHQDPIHPPLLTHTRHMPSPFHSSRLFSLLTKRNQVPGHLITRLDIYSLLTCPYNTIQNIVPLCQIPCLLYFRHYCLSKQHFRENSDITFYHFTNPTSSPIQLNIVERISSLSLQHRKLKELLRRVLSQKYLRREFESHTVFRYDQAINYFQFICSNSQTITK